MMMDAFVGPISLTPRQNSAITLVVVAALFFADWTAAETEVLGGVVTWSATLASIVVTGYMGNSSVEKYAERKFAVEETLDGKAGKRLPWLGLRCCLQRKKPLRGKICREDYISLLQRRIWI